MQRREHDLYVPFHRNKFNVILGMPAEQVPNVDDIDVVTPRDLAVDSVDVPDQGTFNPKAGTLTAFVGHEARRRFSI